MLENSALMIPKTIHYVWVGPAKQTPLVKQCIESWKTFAPDYTVRFWNEKNSPMSHPYVRAMYAKKKWAFVSDYIRFWALQLEGGVYLDTDMELLKPIDLFLTDTAFVGRSKSGTIESSIIGTIPDHPLVSACVDFYDADQSFSIKNTSPIVLQTCIETGAFPDVTVYGPDHFHPCDDGEPCNEGQLDTAFARHHWAESWVSFARSRKLARRTGVMPLLKNLFGA